MPLTDPALVIFDCDGVLVDSEPIAGRIFAEALGTLGLDLSLDQVFEEFTGLSMDSCVARIRRRLGHAVPADFVDELQSRTFGAFREELRPVEGVAEALGRIRIPCCVASSGEHEKIRLSLGLTGLLSRFEGHIFSATDVARGKPHPDLYLHSARTMGSAPRATVVVEDSVPGVRGAVAARMRVLGYAARIDPARLAAEGAETFTKMERLPDLLSGEGAATDP